MDSYTAFKIIHILGVVLFLGNITVTAVWKGMADRTGRPEVVGFAQRLVTLTDWVFTLGGVVLILIGGYGMVHARGLDIDGTPWLNHGLMIFTVSGVIWVGILIPLQVILGRMALKFETGAAIPARYWTLNRYWFFWGIVATIIPALNLAVMVAK